MNSPGELDETVNLVDKAGRRCVAEVADVRDLEQMEQVTPCALDEFGKVDIMVANAGTWTATPVHEMPIAE